MQTPALTPSAIDLQDAIADSNRQQVRAGRRFAFGRNWRRFLTCLDEGRIRAAEQSLCAMLQLDDLRGRRFLDVGSGSGLFSLAAMRLGAEYVHCFDFDPQCVACAQELRQRYYPDATHWQIEGGDILCPEYLQTLQPADIVYSWGVLHQTGAMWQALDNVAGLVAEDGLLYISLYNQQPLMTPIWTKIKYLYNHLPTGCRWPLVWGYLAVKTPLLTVRDTILGRKPWRRSSAGRGMSWYYDAVDWIGGYPHETARPESVFGFFRDRGFQMTELTTVGGGSGCNEFVFRRIP